MLWVFVILIALTAITVWSSNVHQIVIGNSVIHLDANVHIWMALVIAVVKGTLVFAYFMHLIYDKKINTVVLCSTIFAVVLFMGLTLYDLASRDTIIESEGGPVATWHPILGDNATTSGTDEAGSIFPGGNLMIYSGGNAEGRFKKTKSSFSIVEYVRNTAVATSAAGYTDPESEPPGEDESMDESPDAPADPGAHPDEAHEGGNPPPVQH